MVHIRHILMGSYETKAESFYVGDVEIHRSVYALCQAIKLRYHLSEQLKSLTNHWSPMHLIALSKSLYSTSLAEEMCIAFVNIEDRSTEGVELVLEEVELDEECEGRNVDIFSPTATSGMAW